MTISSSAEDIYAGAVVCDAHSGFFPAPSADLTKLEIWRRARVHYLSINVGFDLLPWVHTVETLAAFRHWILANRNNFVLAANVEDIRRAKSDKRLAITFDIEGANALNGQLEMVSLYHRLGVRQMSLAYNRNNRAGGGCHDSETGLTGFGREVIREMNRVGMLVDLTHCSHRTSMEAMEVSTKPVIFSHSNARALCPHERNITNDQIRACASTGGLVGVVGVSRFLGLGGIRTEVIADHVEYFT